MINEPINEQIKSVMRDFNINYGADLKDSLAFCMYVCAKVKNKYPDFIIDDIDKKLDLIYSLYQTRSKLENIIQGKDTVIESPHSPQGQGS